VCSERLDPRTADAAQIADVIATVGLTDLSYYNPATHQALFALPNYFQKLLD
jgi:spermidine synthase